MKLVEQIKQDLLVARKERETGKLKANLLNTLYSDLALAAKTAKIEPANLDDDKAIAIIKRFVKPMEESLDKIRQNGRSTENVEQEIRILKGYLPKMLSADELTAIIKDVLKSVAIKDKKAVGLVMKHLSANYKNQFDGRQANELCLKLIG